MSDIEIHSYSKVRYLCEHNTELNIYINMKKKFLFVSLLSLAILTCYYSYSREEVTNVLLLENVEALAGGESNVPVHCVGSGTVDCPFNHVKVRLVASGYSFEDLY